MKLELKNKPLKVTLLTPNFAKGGVDRAYLLGQVLRKLHYQVEIVGFLFGKEIYPLPPKDLPIYCLPGQQFPSLATTGFKLLPKIDGDIVYAVKPKPTSFGLALLKKLFTRKPVILDLDDWELSWLGGETWKYRPPHLKQVARDLFKADGQFRNPDCPLYLQGMERLTPYANAITVDTQFLQQRFGGTYLANGKDTDLFDPSRFNPDESRVKYGLSGYRVLMFPGAPRPHKGLEDVLIALDQLNEPDLRLVIVGGNPYDDYDDRLIEQWGRWIVMLPPVPLEQMPEVVAAAHVVVVPQRNTATAQAQFPIKLTEGMAMAKPILATRVGDIPSIVGEAGYLVDPESPMQIAQQIQLIFQDITAAHARGMALRKRCVEHYSVDAMAPILMQVIASL